ncbi:hypothetical protein MJO28_013824 [Puccinia striiformis f. sp. tritici]|uniref:Uncharacterized protein n=1 Tax=Puccinia striiformis f. sp. tritici TaxID=168172 RepID=A0ACC0DVK7_9BASI|nr:hypothetical protein MJO28_013824 [Puccinia striiformis f. sp. tritici]KAI7941589.1 hypothetical protein MJO29_013663 [Puccinia striiformis f. sp. tritici]
MRTDWMLQICILALSSEIRRVVSFDGWTSRVRPDLGKAVIDSSHESVEPGEGEKLNLELNLWGRSDLEGTSSGMSQWKRLGDKINYREVEDPGLDLSLSLSLGTGENRLKTHEQKQPRTDSSEFRTSNRASRSVASCRSKILADIDIWKNDFEKLELDRPEDKSHVQAHVEVVIKSVENLFHERLHEEDERQHIFEGYPIANAVHYQSQGNEHVSEAIPTKNYFPHNVLEGEYIHGSRTGHLSSGQFRNSRKEWLKSIAEVGKIWNTSRSPDLPLRLPMIRRWFDLMMNVIVELQKHQILSNAYLSHFLNEEDRGQFILRYVATKSYPTEISSVYVNFNQKLSLLEDPSMAKMVNIFQGQPKIFTTHFSPYRYV